MAVLERMTRLFLVMFAHYLAIQGVLSSVKMEMPVLNVSEGYKDVDLQTTLYVKCSGAHELEWQFHSPTKTDVSCVRQTSSTDRDTTGNSFFENVIHLQLDTYACTGRYTCIFKYRKESASIYIFVNDGKQLLLPANELPYQIVDMSNNQPTTVPCLPTSSKIEVRLLKSNVFVEDLNSIASFCDDEDMSQVTQGSNVFFDPTKGFQIPQPGNSFRGPFCCRAVFGQSKQDISFLLVIRNPEMQELISTTIFPAEFGFSVINEKLILTCAFVINRMKTHRGWSYPAASSDRVILTETMSPQIMSRADEAVIRGLSDKMKSLTLDGGLTTDSGLYKCSVMDDLYNIYISQVFLRIQGFEDSDCLKKESRAVEFRADPEDFPIYHKYKWNVITRLANITEKPGKYEIFEKKGIHVLRILNLQPSDSGLYRFSTTTVSLMTTTFFRLVVLSGNLTLESNFTERFFEGSKVYDAFCRSETSMGRHLELIWRPLSEVDYHIGVTFEIVYNEDKYFPNIFNVSKDATLHNIYTQTLRMSLRNGIPGEYLCRERTLLGYKEKRLLSIAESRNHTFPKKLPPILRIEEFQILSLTCAAKKSLYEDIEIQRRSVRNDSVFQSLSGAVITASDDDDNPYLEKVITFNMITTKDSGIYVCSATHTDKRLQPYQTSVFVFVTGTGNKFIYDTNMNSFEVNINFNKTLELFCYVNGFPPPEVRWRINNESLTPETSEVKFLDDFQKLVISHVTEKHDGDFTCTATNKVEVQSLHTRVRVKMPPVISRTNMDSSKLEVNNGEHFELFCYVDELKNTHIKWYLNGVPLPTSSNNTKLRFQDNFQKLVIINFEEENAGVYECKAKNNAGSVSVNKTLTSKKAPIVLDPEHIAGFCSLAILLGILGLLTTFYFVRRFSRRKKVPTAWPLSNNETSSSSSSEEELLFEESDEATLLPLPRPLPEQITGLPYDKKWEFPKDRLKFGKPLGTGEFGRVVKAKAVGICDSEPSTTVAVKMVKDKRSEIQKRALFKELKFLILLGHHLNVVNLLGAVTKYTEGGVMLILEYCRYGNLRHYLLKHRNRFSIRVSAKNNDEDDQPNICSSPSSRVADNSACGLLGPLAEALPCSTELQEKDDSTSDRKVLPDGHGQNFLEGCKERTRRSKRTLTTRDLLSYAFQCASGMRYLASKKLIHRDLAARNILLAEGNVIKISDFGLTKDVYQYPSYNQKKGPAALPIKWMAIESLCDNVFTTKSDVWSFGVVLWEIFTLGENPYPGMKADHNFYESLKEGYRMQQPDCAPDEIYDVMRNCWKSDPRERPNFWKLCDILGSLLDEKAKQRYIDLNELSGREYEMNVSKKGSICDLREENSPLTNAETTENFENCPDASSFGTVHDATVIEPDVEVVPLTEFEWNPKTAVS